MEFFLLFIIEHFIHIIRENLSASIIFLITFNCTNGIKIREYSLGGHRDSPDLVSKRRDAQKGRKLMSN